MFRASRTASKRVLAVSGVRTAFSRFTAQATPSVSPLTAVAALRSFATTTGNANVEDYFGVNVFDRRAMREYLPPQIYESYQNSVNNALPIDNAVAEATAKALLQWSRVRGATHFTHWFQPLNGTVAEKHDTFLDTASDNETPIARFRAKELITAEPDGSSFPNGGLRVTHTARGYVTWDPTSPPFLLNHGNGATLYVPSLFYSWKDNQSLDEKTPLLRSSAALRREALRLFDAMGDKSHTSIHTDSGLEQEFFLIDRDMYLKRPDLIAAGRTLIGAAPAKGQELEDQYFGNKSVRFLDAIHDFEIAMWKLGIPIQTRHREVAPGQYEVAPKFASTNVATDRNLLMMDQMRRVARRHNMAALFHEKPFQRVNGSGKHNNWSFGTNRVPSVLNPGNTPETNSQFMLFLAATIRAVDHHGDLMRWAISGPGNDHRLGANEAPPAIISAYLGDDLQQSVDRFIKNDKSASKIDLSVNLGVPTLAHLTRAPTDRNRTSPFAFTGNKFEFRALGASHNASKSNMVLNTILAESIRAMTKEITALRSSGKTAAEAVDTVSRATLQKHQRVIFNGNNYDTKWHDEAERRGLPNLRTTPDALSQFNSEKNMKLFSSLGVMSPAEVESRHAIGHQDYNHKLHVEGKTMVDLALNYVIPAGVEYQRLLSKAISGTSTLLAKNTVEAETRFLGDITLHLNNAISRARELEHQLEKAESSDSGVSHSAFILKNVIPVMSSLRESCDHLEQNLPRNRWPLPTYQDMLFFQD